MALINFQKQFANDVEIGVKRQTIRAIRKRPIVPGETLYLYTGLRTKNCRKLRQNECISVNSIEITTMDIIISGDSFFYYDYLNQFAVADGFTDFRSMVEWFSKTHGLPFNGWLIKW
jgi:hypothetical protein